MADLRTGFSVDLLNIHTLVANNTEMCRISQKFELLWSFLYIDTVLYKVSFSAFLRAT